MCRVRLAKGWKDEFFSLVKSGFYLGNKGSIQSKYYSVFLEQEALSGGQNASLRTTVGIATKKLFCRERFEGDSSAS